MSAEEFYRAVTRVEPGFIRVEADELTYDFHIMLRVEIECALMDGSLAVADLPSAWNAAIKRDLGLDVPDDSQGVLQDVHWSTGYIGSFPTYTIGNVMAAQMMETLAPRRSLPRYGDRGRRIYRPRRRLAGRGSGSTAVASRGTNCSSAKPDAASIQRRISTTCGQNTRSSGYSACRAFLARAMSIGRNSSALFKRAREIQPDGGIARFQLCALGIDRGQNPTARLGSA